MAVPSQSITLQYCHNILHFQPISQFLTGYFIQSIPLNVQEINVETSALIIILTQIVQPDLGFEPVPICLQAQCAQLTLPLNQAVKKGIQPKLFQGVSE